MPDVIVDCPESRQARDLVRLTMRLIKPHKSKAITYDFLVFRLRESMARGEWADVPELRRETAFAVAQRTARRLLRMEVPSA